MGAGLLVVLGVAYYIYKNPRTPPDPTEPPPEKLPKCSVDPPGGKYCPEARGPSEYCPDGTFLYLSENSLFAKPTKNDCKPCGQGNFCPSGSTEDLPCPDGYMCNMKEMTKSKCPAGSYCANNTKTKCPSDGHTLCEAGSGAAVNCPDGYLCPGSTEKIKCTSGIFCAAGTKAFCPIGSYCPAASSAPVPCAPGFFSDTAGASTCKQCPVNTYCTGGSSVPTKCRGGKQSPAGSEAADACVLPSFIRTKPTKLVK